MVRGIVFILNVDIHALVTLAIKVYNRFYNINFACNWIKDEDMSEIQFNNAPVRFVNLN